MSKKITVSKAIREGLLEEMRRDDKMFIMGEDMAVMGNVFAITTGFLDEFGPNRVIDTPISEEGFLGMAVGAAMRGMHPCVELMYDDFVTVCADPLFNQAAKEEMDEAVKFADESPYPDPSEVTDDMYTADNERCVAR